MFHVPEQNRVTKNSPLATLPNSGLHGLFIIPMMKGQFKWYCGCLASNGEGWEHVSVSLLDDKGHPRKFCPSWEEMCKIKDIFWDKDDTVIQYHPAEKDYVNMHEYVLHLWKPIGIELPTPNPLMIGIKQTKDGNKNRVDSNPTAGR